MARLGVILVTLFTTLGCSQGAPSVTPAALSEFNALVAPAVHADKHWHLAQGAGGGASIATPGFHTTGTAPSSHGVLVAVPTANVWEKTQLMLISLAAVHDEFDLLVMDDLSADGTAAHLAARQVFVIQPEQSEGLTYLWNLAYRFWKRNHYQYLFIVNNDVLIPDGVITRLVQALDPATASKDANGKLQRCDLVTPLSTARGKGYLPQNGIENVFKVDKAMAPFIQNPLNYVRIQGLLDQLNHSLLPLDRFSGFFFGINRNMVLAAHSEHNLFNPDNRIIGQEVSIAKRINKKKGLRMCLHTGTFVYHFKGSTVPFKLGGRREDFKHATSDKPSAMALVIPSEPESRGDASKRGSAASPSERKRTTHKIAGAAYFRPIRITTRSKRP